MKYGEQIIKAFDVEKDLEIWPNQHKKNYVIKLTLPEFCCLCPRSGYPDFATIYIDYIPDELVVGYGLDYDQMYRNLPFIGVVHLDDENWLLPNYEYM